MRRIIFHIGPEKTGSTLVQSYAELNEDAIKDASCRPVKFLGPAAVRDSGLLADAQSVVTGRQKDIPGLANLLAQAEADMTVIISHESLFGHPDTAGFYGSNGGRKVLIQRMLEGSHDAGEFVFYYKQPHKLIESYYRHHIMHGGNLDPMEYLKRVPLLKMSFIELRNDLISMAGSDRVTMLNASINNAESFFRNFFLSLQLIIDSKSILVPTQTNKSWSALKTDLTRIANTRMNPDERIGWVRAMSSIPLGENSNAPMVPSIVTQLVERVYRDEHVKLTTLLNDKYSDGVK